jgi:hypothetical protein
VQPRGGQAQIRGNMPISSDGTTSSHNIKEDGNAIRTNGECPRWITPYQKTSNTNSMSKLVSPKTFQSNKSAKIFKMNGNYSQATINIPVTCDVPIGLIGLPSKSGSNTSLAGVQHCRHSNTRNKSYALSFYVFWATALVSRLIKEVTMYYISQRGAVVTVLNTILISETAFSNITFIQWHETRCQPAALCRITFNYRLSPKQHLAKVAQKPRSFFPGKSR